MPPQFPRRAFAISYAVTHISRESYKEIVWPLPAGDLLYVGKATREVLARRYISTIGDLANSSRESLHAALGKMGEQLHIYANGLDDSPVLTAAESQDIQSIGNGMTFKRNLITRDDILTGAAALSDSVASRMREAGLKCTTVQVTIKDVNLKVITRQKTLESPTWLARALVKHSMELIEKSWKIGVPIRMLTVTASNFLPADQAGEQLSLFGGSVSREEQEKQEKLEKAIDAVRGKFGGESLTFGSVVKNDLGIHEHYGDE